jgi:hypothetical protein
MYHLLALVAGVSFHCGDLLAGDLSSVGMLLLTEQCWDDQLIAKVGAALSLLPVACSTTRITT